MATNGIDFIIGGKDKAAPAFNAVEKSLGRVEAGVNSLRKASTKLMAAAGPLIAIFAAVKTAMAAIGGVKAANAAFDEQTASVKRLTNALAIRGQAAASSQMQAMAKDLERLTGVSDQTTMALMQQAQSMGFATDRMDDAAKAALGLGEATGWTAEQSLGNLKAALEGNFEAFHGLNPQIMYMQSNSQKMAAVLAIANQGLDGMAASATSVSGSGRRADTAIGSLMETIGTIIAPIRVLINAGLQQLSESLTTLLAPAAEYAQQVLANIGPIMDWVKEKVVSGINAIIAAYTWLETGVTNMGQVFELWAAMVALGMEKARNIISHTLTVALPEYAKWFGTNFVNIFKDAFNAVFAVITNAGKIIGDMVYQIFEFIASGGEGGTQELMRGLGQAASRSLLDGFESSLTALPDIAERQLTQREKDLADKIGAIGGRLGQEFSDRMSERMLGVGTGLGEELNAATRNLDLQASGAVRMQGNQATEGRLLTRGPGTDIPNKLDQIINLLKKPPGKEKEEKDRNDTLQAINELKRRRESEFQLEIVK